MRIDASGRTCVMLAVCCPTHAVSLCLTTDLHASYARSARVILLCLDARAPARCKENWCRTIRERFGTDSLP